jgi:hypothetical protein
MGAWSYHTSKPPIAPQIPLHIDLLGLLRQHSQCRDQRHPLLLVWMVLNPLGAAALAEARPEVAPYAE